VVLEIKPIKLKPSQELVDWKPIYEEIDTKYQLIKFYEDENKHLILTLNRYVQFIEGEDEQNYHNTLILPSFAINPNIKNCLILGGGDGLAARTILKHKSDVEITLVELDKKMIEIFKTVPRLIKLNENSLSKCNIYTENALYWVPRNITKIFDMIVLDFPDPTSWELKRLYSKEFLSDIIYLLGEGGIITIQCHSDIANHVAFLVKELLDNSVILSYEMPYLGSAKMVIGRRE